RALPPCRQNPHLPNCPRPLRQSQARVPTRPQSTHDFSCPQYPRRENIRPCNAPLDFRFQITPHALLIAHHSLLITRFRFPLSAFRFPLSALFMLPFYTTQKG